MQEDKSVSQLEIEILEIIESSSLDVPTEEPKSNSKSKSTTPKPTENNVLSVEKPLDDESEKDLFSIEVLAVDIINDDEFKKDESSGHANMVESENECLFESESECESGGSTLANSIDSNYYFEKVVSEKVKKSDNDADDEFEGEISIHDDDDVRYHQSEDNGGILNNSALDDNHQDENSETEILGSNNANVLNSDNKTPAIHIINESVNPIGKISDNAEDESENGILDNTNISDKFENEIPVLHAVNESMVLQIGILDSDENNLILGNSSGIASENGISVHVYDESDDNNRISDTAAKSSMSLLVHAPNPERKISLQVPDSQSESWISVHANELLTILTILTGFVIIVILTIIAITD